MTPIILKLVIVLVGASGGGKQEPVDFDSQVRPILSDRCFRCHGPDNKKRKAGLRLDTDAGLHKDLAEIVRRVTTNDEDDRMPPSSAGPVLTKAQVDVLRRWIAEGAPWRGHWAFEPVARPQPPAVDDSWVRNDIDRFVLTRLRRENLTPSPEADRVTLLRRVSLDLIGLPPMPAQVRAFVDDKRPDAYERQVARLLASPHYGERWGRRWLDLARYADSNGYSIDAPRQIWPYRDWVVKALNRDLPFDQFVIEQIAGDLLPGATVEQKIATGFHRNTMLNEEGGIDLEQVRVDAVADRVATTGSVLLGLTLGCARCHDHKFDPLTQKEFFQIFAFLNNVDEPELPLAGEDDVARLSAIDAQLASTEGELARYEKKWLAELSEVRRKEIPVAISTIMALGANQRDPAQWRTLFDFLLGQGTAFRERIETIQGLRRRQPHIDRTLVMKERAEPRETHVHIGGDFTRHGDPVEAGVPSVLHPLAGDRAEPKRLAFARWLVDSRNPLVGRVTVNRIWQQYFGTGLVETENDFGTQGARPTHPELLDWLASEFVRSAWSQKAIHRVIVTSATYRQSSRNRAELTERDPLNRWLGRQNRLRLDAEIVRDVALSASGLLDGRVGGPPVFPPQPDGVFGFTQVPRVWTASKGPDRYRRGIYTYLWRSAPHPALAVFDAPDGQATCTRRNRSTTPLQALTLLNDKAFVELSQGLAGRALRGRGRDADRLTDVFRRALARAPGRDELARLQTLLAEQRKSFAADTVAAGPVRAQRDRSVETAAWTAVSRVLFNLDEFITRE